jgi:pimeloyl-ACP methyl ester carboxylesterase
MTLESRFVQVGGIRLHYLETGNGNPPVVLVHGLGSTVTKWRDVLPIIGARRRTLAVDLPGFGRSDAPRARYTFGFLAGAVRSFLDATGVERCVLVGNSLGGMAAMWLAAAWPERVAGLVLMAPALPPPAEALPDRGTIARMLAGATPGVGEVLYTAFVRTKSPEELVADGLARNVADRTRVSSETMTRLHEEAIERKHRPELRRALMSAQRHLIWMVTARRADVERVAASIRVPTLMLWGSEDKLVPVATGEEWVVRIPGAELIVMDGAGHNPQLEIPDRVAEIALAFADRLDAGVVSSPAGTPERRG